MGKKQNFVLVDLKDDESKKLAQIISNDTSRKILDYLSDGDSTETDLAQELRVPISTIHYNMKALLRSGMVEADEFHYSEKGKEVLHYSLANKCVIIAPKKTEELMKKLKGILPIAWISFAGSAILYFEGLFHHYADGAFNVANAKVLSGGLSDEVVPEAAQLMHTAASEAVHTEIWTEIVASNFFQIFWKSPAMWFLIGGLFVMIVLMSIEIYKYHRLKKDEKEEMEK